MNTQTLTPSKQASVHLKAKRKIIRDVNQYFHKDQTAREAVMEYPALIQRHMDLVHDIVRLCPKVDADEQAELYAAVADLFDRCIALLELASSAALELTGEERQSCGDGWVCDDCKLEMAEAATATAKGEQAPVKGISLVAKTVKRVN